MTGEKCEFFAGIAVIKDDGRREAAPQGQNRIFRNVFEDPFVGFVRENERFRLFGGGVRLIDENEIHVVARAVEKAYRDRNDERFLFLLIRRGGGGLPHAQREGVRGFVVGRFRRHARGARLRPPTGKLCEIRLVGIGHRPDEVVAGDGAAVVALDVEIQSLAETVFTQHRLQHADDFGTLFVHRHGVEIVDFAVAVGADGVRHGASIFRKLGSAQRTDVADAFDGAA